MALSEMKLRSGRVLARSLPRTILYLGWLFVALSTCVALGAGIAAAQEELPQIFPGERKVPRKKDAGPRALALVKIANGKTSLVPIAILINGKFWDATAYKATPIPMALENGTVYEGEHTGNSAGLFTVSSALHSNALNMPSPWIGTGQWLPTGKDAPNQSQKAETIPVGIDTSDEPPRLTKNPAASKSTQPASSAPASTPPASPPSGDEPPRLSKPTQTGSSGTADTSQNGSSPSGSSKTGSTPQNSPTTPGDAKTSGGKPADTAPAKTSPDVKDVNKKDSQPKAPESDSGAAETNRPTLRRGKPAQPLPDEEIPGYSKPGATPKADGDKPVKADEGPAQLIPAISDASGPEPHSFVFTWLPEEENDRRKQMTDLAKTELRSYLDAQAKASITPESPSSKAAARKTVKKALEPVLENPQMVAYDLWTTNQPVILFAADAHMPPPAGSPQAAADSQIQYTIMLVARTDIYNNLHKLYVGITDKYHLDITPRLELIDAVDADGDGRGELLFRETSDAGTGWLIYKASADKLWKMYDSLHPE